MKLRRIFLTDDEKLIKIRKWYPRIDSKGIWGPSLLVERYGQRRVCSMRWDIALLKEVFRKS